MILKVLLNLATLSLQVLLLWPLFDKVKNTYPDIFPREHESDLGISEDIVFAIVFELQSYSILRTHKQIVRQSYENVIQVLIDKSGNNS